MMTENIDLSRYMGVWYEIGRFDKWYERGLVAVTATYAMRPDGKVSVLNSGRRGTLEGPLKQARGRAYVVDPREPGHLRVAFFWRFYSDYRVLAIDKLNYSYALVGGGKGHNALWILSRTPSLPQETVQMLLARAAELGYDISRMIFPVQVVQ